MTLFRRLWLFLRIVWRPVWIDCRLPWKKAWEVASIIWPRQRTSCTEEDCDDLWR
jgi:hypothetical protein